MAEKKDPIRSLIEQGRRAGKLSNTEISDAMAESGRNLDVEAMENKIKKLLELHKKELVSVYETIADKRDEYSDD